ncbi:hypothetical protein IW144_003384 [Coemansia sp. RSA 522]|nr:hypothetical protein IW144_003384 [Coemansia sp. RSA 522]
MADNTHDNTDYTVTDKAKMTLDHAPAGLYLPGIDETTHKEAVRLCARDFLEHHVFFNDRGFHNHLNHHLLSVFSLGAPAKRLQEVFDQNKEILLPSHSPMDVDITTENFTEHFSNERCYPNYVSFFQRELDAAGDNWKAVACDYFFDPRVFPLGMSGIFHPFIQLGYGLEFESKTIVATALAQTCVHSSTFKTMFSEHVFADICTGELEDNNHGLSLMQILDKMRQDPLSISMEFSAISSKDTHCTVSDLQNNVNNQWLDVFSGAIASNDMHVPKVVRTLWRGSLLYSFPSKLTFDNDYTLPPPVNWLYLARITVDTIDFSRFRDPQQQAKEGKRFWTFGMVGHDKFWDTYPKE